MPVMKCDNLNLRRLKGTIVKKEALASRVRSPTFLAIINSLQIRSHGTVRYTKQVKKRLNLKTDEDGKSSSAILLACSWHKFMSKLLSCDWSTRGNSQFHSYMSATSSRAISNRHGSCPLICMRTFQGGDCSICQWGGVPLQRRVLVAR